MVMGIYDEFDNSKRVVRLFLSKQITPRLLMQLGFCLVLSGGKWFALVTFRGGLKLPCPVGCSEPHMASCPLGCAVSKTPTWV